MRYLLSFLAFSATLLAFGQNTAPRSSDAALRKADATAVQVTDSLASLLQLSADQRNSILALNQKLLRAEMAPTKEEDPRDRDERMVKLAMEHHAAVEAVLTPEQVARLNKLREEWNARYVPQPGN
ncbi:MAG TPA: hypothetical protein VHL57_08185 [Flavobacteriales bacterium]|jgi:hypothetical protein|nr:hypothetical protein [Flavobacteriales bacterium]